MRISGKKKKNVLGLTICLTKEKIEIDATSATRTMMRSEILEAYHGGTLESSATKWRCDQSERSRSLWACRPRDSSSSEADIASELSGDESSSRFIGDEEPRAPAELECRSSAMARFGLKARF